MPADVSMKICPDCKAPNPVRQMVCFACGQSLNKRRDDIPRPGEATYPCLNCQAAIPLSAKTCPGCGRLVSGPTTGAVLRSGVTAASSLPGIVALGPPPPGWEVSSLPDGTVQLRRTAVRQMMGDIGLPAVCLLLGVALIAGVLPGRASPLPDSIAWIGFIGICPIAFGIAAGIWQLCGREEIRVGPNLFERRKVLGGYERTCRFGDGTIIRVATHHGSGRSGNYTERRLRLESVGQQFPLDGRVIQEGFFGLFAVAPAMNDDMAHLAHYLSSITGWPVIDSGRSG